MLRVNERGELDVPRWVVCLIWLAVLVQVVALLPSVAAAQSLDEGVTGTRSAIASRYQFGSPGTATAYGSLGEPVTVTRASAKNCLIGGVWTSAASNKPCIGDAGLSVEGSRTQYALNNCTTPADQTVTLAAGAHTLWLEGTGTVAAAVGTATATGLPCTATAASACSFTVTVGGTVTLDVEGAVARFQVENGARSSLVCATTTPVTRAADAISSGHRIADGGRWCISATASPDGSWTRGTEYIWSLGTGTAANSANLKIYNGQIHFDTRDAAGTLKQANVVSPGFADGSAHRITCCNDGGALSISVDGAKQTTGSAGAGTGIVGTVPAAIYIGARTVSALDPWNGSISGVTTCNAAAPSECQ